MPMILIRHGESLAINHPELWKIPSNSAIGLSAKGIQQAVSLSSVMSNLLSSLSDDLVHSTRVFKSGLARAIQTLDICSSVSTYRTLGGINPYNRDIPGPNLNEFLDWRDTRPEKNPYLSLPLSDPYELWLADKAEGQVNIRTWSDMRYSVRSATRFMRPITDTGELAIVFAHHYPINAILAEASSYSHPDGYRIYKSLIRHIQIPNAVPILLGFPHGTNFPGCLIGEHLVESSQKHTVSA